LAIIIEQAEFERLLRAILTMTIIPLLAKLPAQMSLLKLGAVVVLLGFALLALVSRVSRAIAHRQFAAENGCKPILHRFPHKDAVFGLDLIVGNVRAFREQRFMELLRSRHSTIGTTFSARAMARRGIFTIDPENVKTVLSLWFRDYCLGDRPPIMGPLLGRGIFVTDGDEWAHSRALLRPNFVRDQVADLSLVDSHIQNLLHLVHPGETVELQQLFLRFTLDSATNFLFGHSTHTLTSSGEGDRAFSKAFNSALEHMALQFRMGPFRKLVPGRAEATEAYNVCRAYVDRFVDDSIALRKRSASTVSGSAKEEKRSTPAEGGVDHTRERSFFLRELAKSTDDRDKIRDELLNILIAGRDTVASLLSSLFHVLARRPDIWKKVQAEMAQLEPGRSTYDQLRNLKYAKYCINESELTRGL
jgi:cytochrome P450